MDTTRTNRTLSLSFGRNGLWEIPDDQRISSFLSPAIAPADDLSSTIEQALAHPLEFPSMDQTVVPGDSLVFPVDPVLPGLMEVLPRVIGWFADCGTSPDQMSVVMAGNDMGMANNLSNRIREELGAGVSVETHDPDDQQHIAYVAANRDADPIYMNRTLVDADVVVPITCCRPTSALDYLGAYGIYPLLSDRATRGAFYRLSKLEDPQSRDRLTSWADQAARWAGFLVGIQVIPSGHNTVGEVLAGLTEPLERESRRRMEQAWKTPAAISELTVALLDGEAQQTWLGIARALHTASRCTSDHGAIVLCTQARETLGKSIGRLRATNASPADLAEKLAHDSSDDAIAASLVHQTTRDKHVYLVSQMKPEIVESLGLGVIDRPSELLHLIEQFPSTVILGSAQHRHVELDRI